MTLFSNPLQEFPVGIAVEVEGHAFQADGETPFDFQAKVGNEGEGGEINLGNGVIFTVEAARHGVEFQIPPCPSKASLVALCDDGFRWARKHLPFVEFTEFDDRDYSWFVGSDDPLPLWSEGQRYRALRAAVKTEHLLRGTPQEWVWLPRIIRSSALQFSVSHDPKTEVGVCFMDTCTRLAPLFYHYYRIYRGQQLGPRLAEGYRWTLPHRAPNFRIHGTAAKLEETLNNLSILVREEPKGSGHFVTDLETPMGWTSMSNAWWEARPKLGLGRYCEVLRIMPTMGSAGDVGLVAEDLAVVSEVVLKCAADEDRVRFDPEAIQRKIFAELHERSNNGFVPKVPLDELDWNQARNNWVQFSTERSLPPVSQVA